MNFSARLALGLLFSQTEYMPCSQARQLPQAIGKGTTTRSPTRRFDTSGPTSTTSPMNSWPRMSPLSMVGMKPSYRCRSEPQIADEVMRMIASRAFRILGSGTVRTSTVLRPIQQLAFMGSSSRHGLRDGLTARAGRDAAWPAAAPGCPPGFPLNGPPRRSP